MKKAITLEWKDFLLGVFLSATTCMGFYIFKGM
jgi:hypothetical protein